MTDSRRPDPDALLARLREEEARQHRGRLKLFFGAAPGVGKTYTMLEAARARQAEGVDVVVGVVETHGRSETARLTEGLTSLPRRVIDYKGSKLQEFDLDGALALKPALILVDELAHTNAPGDRHGKRWQDVLELLDAGIDVYTTLNVQHVESLNDVVAQITGVAVRETVPDAVLERADEIELVDVSPDVLLQRLREGRVYLPDQASRALERFFREGNLIALRELALRQTAHRVDAQMRGYMRSQGIRDTWAASERLAVCVGPDPSALRLIRAARRMADRLQAPWTAVFVEVPGRVGEGAREAVVRAFRLAEELGGETITLSGASVADEVIAWAAQRNITRLIVGKPQRRGIAARLRRPLVDALVERSGNIDVFVITGEADDTVPPLPFRRPPPLGQYAWAAGVVGLASALGLALRAFLSTTDVAMLYLLAAVVIGSRVRQRPALFGSVLSIAAFDFCFVPPFYTFAVHDVTYVLTFAMMLAIAIIMSRLTGRIREQADASRAREQRTASAFALSRELAAAREPPEIVSTATRHIEDAFAGRVAFLLADPGGGLPGDDGVASWTFDHGQMAGLGTSTLPASPALYVPLQAAERVFGVVRVEPRDPRDVADPEKRQQLESFVRQAAVALERAALAERNQASRLEVEAERLRTSLLSSLSHDLRTPLGSIEGAASSLLDSGPAVSPEVRRELAETILDESRRMTRLVANLLDMIRVESGSLAVQKQWVPLEEVVGVALIRLDARLSDHTVTTSLPPDLPLVSADDILLEQVFINLLENAAKYTAPGSPIEISAMARDGVVTVSVADRGPGIPSGDETKIFDKFYRASQGDTVGGVGLGLTICRGIIQAHGGRIWAERRAGGGAVLRFTLPQDGPPPVPPAEELIEEDTG